MGELGGRSELDDVEQGGSGDRVGWRERLQVRAKVIGHRHALSERDPGRGDGDERVLGGGASEALRQAEGAGVDRVK